MTVRLRTATDLDMPAVGALHYQSRASAYVGLITPAALTFGSAEALGEWWAERRRWEADTHRLTVAVADSEIVGFSYLGPSEDEGVTELYAIHVLPGHVGTGVGRALMNDALPHLGPRAVLWVLEGNASGRAFYEHRGWRWSGERRSATDAGGATELLYLARGPRP